MERFNQTDDTFGASSAAGDRPQFLIVGSTPLLIATGFTLFISSLAIVLNFSIMVTFLKNSRLINAFTVHVLNLAIINLGSGLLLVFCFMPLHNFNMDLLKIRLNCAVYRFTTFFASYMVIHQHFVICFDRWLALLVPVWYHNKRQAKYGWRASLCFVGSGAAWSLAIVVCEFGGNAVQPGTYCSEPVHTVMLWVAISLAVLVPQGFIYVSYPFVLFLVWKRTGFRQQTRVPEQGSFKFLDPRGCLNSPDEVECPTSPPEKPDGITEITKMVSEKRVIRKTPSRHATLVAWLALAQIVLWLPNTIIQLCRLEYAPLYTEDVVTSLSLLGSWLLIADPVIYLAFSPELRKETMKTLRISWLFPPC